MIQFENTYNNKCEFLITDDFNARVSDLPDYTVDDQTFLNELDILPDDYVHDVEIQRAKG